MPKILILGGIRDAVELSEAASLHADIVYSLAGKTDHPMIPKGCEIISGGFGGQAGLSEYLRLQGFHAVIDATHPFAVNISRHAFAAAAHNRIPIYPYQRPKWQPQEQDQWRSVADMQGLVTMLQGWQEGAALVTLGQRQLQPLADIKNISLIIRMINQLEPLHPLLSDTSLHTILCHPPPYKIDFERRLFDKYNIAVLVTRNSGGARPAKLDVAARNAIPVLMLDDQPSQEKGLNADQIIEKLKKLS